MRPARIQTSLRHTASLAGWVAAGLLMALPALAQYKVVGPDGKVTYTDRPPSFNNEAGVSSLRRSPAPAAAASAAASRSLNPAASLAAGMPPSLQPVVLRYPVSLYTSADCLPCNRARQWLQQRGVPFVERSIGSEEDLQALERAVGGRTVPALNIGPQSLRGFAEQDWLNYLNAAGYPEESRLPRGWKAAAATPLSARPMLATEPTAADPAPLPPRAALPPPPASGIRF